MKVAVIGAGISGLGAAYLLAPHTEVTLYEAQERLGGHANTAHVMFGDVDVAVDTGFMVCNPERYAYFMALLKALRVETVDTNMSFSVAVRGAVEYSSNLRGLLGDVRQVLSPRYISFLWGVMRFNRIAKRLLRSPADGTARSLGDFLDTHNVSEDVREWFLYPMIGSIWSADTSAIAQYPARETLRFLDNHLLLNVVRHAQSGIR